MSDLAKLAADLEMAGKTIKERAGQVIAKTALDIQADAKALAPVDTGNLRNSISSDIDRPGLYAEIGPTADYGIYQELGTSRMAPQPFLGPATDRRLPTYYAALEQLTEEV